MESGPCQAATALSSLSVEQVLFLARWLGPGQALGMCILCLISQCLSGRGGLLRFTGYGRETHKEGVTQPPKGTWQGGY